MPHYLYQVLHITGLLMIFAGYGALLARGLAGSDDRRVKKLGSITSGIGLLLVLVAGFGLVSKLNYSFSAPWLIAKIVIWFALAGLIVLINRAPALATRLWWILLLLGATGAITVYWIRFQAWAI